MGDAVGVDAGDGEQILHHPVEPLGVGTGLGKELYLLLPAQRVIVVDDRRAGPVDGRQRGAQVVGDSPQEVGPHLLRLALHPQLLLLLMRVVRVLVMKETTSITTPEKMFSGMVKLKAK